MNLRAISRETLRIAPAERAKHRAHAAAERGLGHVLVRPDHQRRAAQAPRDGAHQARARRVGVDDVGVEAPRGAGQRRRRPRPGEAMFTGVWTGSRRRLASKPGTEMRSTAARSTILASGPPRGQATATRWPSLQPLDQAHQRELRAAGGSCVVYEKDPHGRITDGNSGIHTRAGMAQSIKSCGAAFRRFAMNRPTASSEQRSRHQASDAPCRRKQLLRIVQHRLERPFQLRTSGRSWITGAPS